MRTTPSSGALVLGFVAGHAAGAVLVLAWLARDLWTGSSPPRESASEVIDFFLVLGSLPTWIALDSLGFGVPSVAYAVQWLLAGTVVWLGRRGMGTLWGGFWRALITWKVFVLLSALCFERLTY